jgi:hypothetical protein
MPRLFTPILGIGWYSPVRLVLSTEDTRLMSVRFAQASTALHRRSEI